MNNCYVIKTAGFITLCCINARYANFHFGKNVLNKLGIAIIHTPFMLKTYLLNVGDTFPMSNCYIPNASGIYLQRVRHISPTCWRMLANKQRSLCCPKDATHKAEQ